MGKIRAPLSLERVIKAREILMAPWNVNNAFVIMWGMADGSNAEKTKTEGTQNQINFRNTEKCQIEAIAKILNMEDRINSYEPENPKWTKTYHIALSDRILSDYLSKIGFNIRKTNIGTDFPSQFPNDLMDVGAYAFWLANGGIASVYINSQTYFFACERFLRDFRKELEAFVDFPGDIGKLRLNKVTSKTTENLWELRYSGTRSYRILSAMFKRTKNICNSRKRDKATELISKHANAVIDRRNKAKKRRQPHKVKIMVALYDALDLMDAATRKRYLGHCGDWIGEIRRRATKNWYLKEGDMDKMEIRELI